MSKIEKLLDAEALMDGGTAAVIALLAGQAAAIPHVIISPRGLDLKPFIIVRDENGEEKVQYISDVVGRPHRKTGAVPLNDAKSFAAFVNLHVPVAPIYGQLSPAKFVAVLNDNTAMAADFRDHRAVFAPEFSPEWKAWSERNGRGKSFKDTESFAYFLEERSLDISEPDPAKFIDLANNFHVNEGVTYSKAQNLGNGEVKLTFSRVVEQGQVGQGAQLSIPTKFKLSIPVFAGFDQTRHEMEAFFRFRIHGGGIEIWYDLIRPTKVVETAFVKMWEEIATATQTPILFGSPE